jgi:hypothetical protein
MSAVGLGAAALLAAGAIAAESPSPPSTIYCFKIVDSTTGLCNTFARPAISY